MNNEQNQSETSAVDQFVQQKYRHGFVTDIESETVPAGLNEDVIAWISARKEEPPWLLEWRIAAYHRWLKMKQPNWAHLNIEPIDFQAISYFSAPKLDKDRPQSLAEVDPKLLETYEKLGVPLHERARLAGVAVDAVFDSVSVGTTFRAELMKAGVIFCSFSEAVREYPELVKRYLSLIEGASSFSPFELLEKAAVLLPQIYSAGMMIPDCYTETYEVQYTKVPSVMSEYSKMPATLATVMVQALVVISISRPIG